MEDINKAFMSAMEAATCPVCLDRLSPNIVCCINGHAICEKCKRTQVTRCPICRKSFSDVKHTSFSQVLEALPYYCKHNGCSDFKLRCDIDRHEKWCSYRLAKCFSFNSGKPCEWIGKVKDLCDHVDKSHGLSKTQIHRSYKNFSVDKEVCLSLGCVYSDNFFWRKIKTDTYRRKLCFEFVWVPVTEPKYSFEAKVEFRSEEEEYMAKIKLKPASVMSEKNCMFFDSAMLNSFIDENKSLNYCLFITKK